MTQLFIRLQDGVPFEHPILEDNFKAAFPDVDVDNLPSTFAKFVRVAPPVVGVHKVYEGVAYDRDGDVSTDVHHVRPMSQHEIDEKQNEVKALWAIHGFASWVFDETTCVYKAPVAKPNDGQLYRWDENTVSWVQE